MASPHPAPQPITVVLVEPHAVLRAALRCAIEMSGRFTVVGEAADAAQAHAVLEKLRPMLALLSHGGVPASLSSADLSALSAFTRPVVLASRGAEAAEHPAPAVPADSSWPQFIDALERAARGAAAPSASSAGADALRALSKREREVFYLLADGVPNRIIAKQLFVSPRTIETHRARVIKKLGLSSTAALIKYAIRRQLLGA